MLRRLLIIGALTTCSLLGVALAGCGEREEGEPVVEGEPLELGEVRYNVLITRFLNPADLPDSEYLAGAAPEPPGQSYLGVFILVRNEGDEAAQTADNYTVLDSEGTAYEPLELEENAYALDIGAELESEDELPGSDSTASEGTIQGALLLFLVDDEISENRPLELQVSGAGGAGLIELDI